MMADSYGKALHTGAGLSFTAMHRCAFQSAPLVESLPNWARARTVAYLDFLLRSVRWLRLGERSVGRSNAMMATGATLCGRSLRLRTCVYQCWPNMQLTHQVRLIPENLLRFLPVLLVGMIQLAACTSTPRQNDIHLSPFDEGHWKVTYRMASPTTAIRLVRSPDDTRGLRWQATSPGFEIGLSSDSDVIRRTDGAEFSKVDMLVPATYVPLPKDYAPFAPFSNGDLLIHSGRFQACPTSIMHTDHDCDGPWLMQIVAPPDAHILLNGRRYDHSARWSDWGDGTKIYIGTATPRSTADFLSVVDPALPSPINDLMSALLPKLMEGFARRLPPLSQRPMLFVSYDPAFKQGHGRQGGTLPGQVFMHFYGSDLGATESSSNTPEEIAWFFAHEVGHLFQHGVTGNRESPWIHEGAAEAFAYIMLNELEAVSKEYLAARRQSAFDGCRDALSDGELSSAASRGSFSDYYQCGLIMFLAIDSALRTNNDDRQDLFSFWSALIDVSTESESWDTANFLKEVEYSTDPVLSKHLLSLVIEKQVDPAAALDRFGTPAR